jgi:pyruvate/2-oxoglutarate dehydrogenase complex dihydrolipoamide acyltransferase (E2) component
VTKKRHELILPDLDMPDVPVIASVWHVPVGRDVAQGESVLEVLAGDVTVDLPAPVGGTLIRRLVAEDEPLHVGQALAIIRRDSPEIT